MKPTPPPGQTVRKRSAARTLGYVVAWILGIPVTLALICYVALLIHPIPLPFLAAQVRNLVVANMPPGTELELGDMALAIEGFAQPVIQFSPVTYKDTTTGAKVQMQALEVGFSPIHALFGQPGATVTVVGPHLQVNQDLFGPRLADLEIVSDPKGGPDTVRVLEGSTAFPGAGIHTGGIDVSGGKSDIAKVRSDNDWLVYNLEAAQQGIASVLEQAQMGRFSRLTVKKGTLDMNDALYAVLRTFTDISLDIAPTPTGKAVEGEFSAKFGDSTMHGVLQRVIDTGGDARLKVSMTNSDLSSFVPNINDKTSMVGIDGSPAVSMDVAFDAKTGALKTGDFRVDLSGTDLRIGTDLFPIASNIVEVTWAPKTGTFTLNDAAISIGKSSAHLSGVVVLGLDDLYGPTEAISLTASSVRIQPNDLAPPTDDFNLSFKGWEAPLYGAVGIDQVILTKGNARIEAKGRVDLLRKGMGVDLAIAGQGITVDDMKRMWPYFVSPEARTWFTKNITSGMVESANMKFAFPVGTLGLNGENKPIPQNGVFIEIVADGVKVKPTDAMAPIEIQGKTRVQMHDADFTLSGDGGVINTDKGRIAIANAAVEMSADSPGGKQMVEISGDLNGGIPAIIAVANQVQPGITKSADLPFDISSLDGDLNVRLLATTSLDANGMPKTPDFTINGHVQDFGSTTPIQGHVLGNGQLNFMATSTAYKIGGTAQVDGVDTNLAINGDIKPGGGLPSMNLNAVVDLADLSKMGFDASQIGTGKVALAAAPAADGSLGVSVDLKSAAINIKDLGITKPSGVPGMLTASITQKADTVDIGDIDLSMGEVKLKGGLEFDSKKGLQSAEFSSFSLSPGDAAQISLTPINGGYQVRVRGDQLDLKPLLKRFFSLDQGSGGPQSTTFTQTIAVDAELKRALGYYKTTAYNLSLDLALKGTDLKKVSLQTQLGGTSSISVATNPTPDGRTLSVAFNDLGSVLRFVGIYPQVEGGSGAFVIQQNTTTKVDTGSVSLRDFAIVDEKKVAEILDAHAESRQLIARSNRLQFSSAKADFTHRVDRVQINNAVVTGPSMGGTGQGFIYTDSKQYDIVGTFIPMFGINNAFGKLFGGGMNGGLFGITFQVKGPLNAPEFKVNPMSALAPGAFRSLFEYRAHEQPRVDGSDPNADDGN